MSGTALPRGNQLLNPYGSQYDGTNITNLIAQAIERVIYDQSPKQYDPLKLLNMIPMEDTNLDEFFYKEKVFSREPLTVYSWATPVITLAGTYATEDELPVRVNHVIMKSGVPYIISAVSHSASANSSTITVVVQTGATALDAGGATFATNDVLNIAGPIISDGMDTLGLPTRVRLIERYNYVQLFQRTQRWDTVEMQKLINAATTNYMDFEKNEKLDQIRLDLFVALVAGVRGEFTVIEASGNKKAKCMNGIFPSLVDGGASHASPSLSGLGDAFESLAFSTNHKASGGTRMIFGTDEMLFQIAKLYKEPGIRYTPNDRIADLNLNKYKFGNMDLVPVTCDLFRANGVLGPEWENRLLILDMNAMRRKKIKGLPAQDMGQTDNKQRGSTFDFTYWWVWAQQSLQFNDVAGSFYIDVQ